MTDITQQEAQSLPLSYPEGAWIGVCGYFFPSEVQWLYKNFTKQVINKTKTIPDYSTTSQNDEISGGDTNTNSDVSTLGSGSTVTGVAINERVSLDWLRYAIQKRLWKLLYNNGKIGETSLGESIFKNELITVLKIAVDNNIIDSYEITDVSINRSTNTISMKFSATLTHTILSVKVSGSLYT